jgi:hypothetical protein
LKNSRRHYFYLIIKLFFYWKSYGIGPRSHGLGPRSRLMGPWHRGSLSAIDSLVCGFDFIKTKGYRWSNLDRWSRCGRLRRGQHGGGVVKGGMPRVFVALFSMRFDPTDIAQRGKLTYGVFERWGVTVVGHTMAVSLPQPSASSTTSSIGRLTTRLGYVGAAWHVEGWCGIGSTRRGLQ